MNKILLLEDEDSVNRGIAFTLEKQGYEVISCKTIKEARAAFLKNDVQLLICDITLPDGCGLDFVKEVRAKSSIHIIFLTALDQEIDQVMGYEAGADDYMTKPFSLSVLSLKVGAYFKKLSGQALKQIQSGNISFETSQMRVLKDGEEICLTKNELRLLRIFMEHPKQVLSKNQLLEQLFDVDGNFVDENTIAVNIRRLREKIEPDVTKPIFIKNIRGIGYVWNQDCRSI